MTVALLAGLAACGRASPQPNRDVAVSVQALWTNGDFEGDPGGTTPPTGWTVTTYLNPTPNGVTGSTSSPPSSFSALNLTAGGKVETYVVSGAAESQIDPDLGAASAFRFPKYGSRGVRVNYKDSTDYGKNRNANGLSQTMTVTASDVDPTDGQVHVRFAVAPVLENPSHGYTQQPYYFVELLNLSRSTTLYRDFNTAGQTGVPWITTTSGVTGNTTLWTNWQLVDLSPGSSFLAIGDQVKLTVIGSGCSLGGHFGRVYVDGTGSSVPGLYAWATGPSSVPVSTTGSPQTISYVIHYTNGAATTATGVHVDMATPPQTTYSSLSGAANCTTPAVGGTGAISCPIGVLTAGSSGSFTVTVRVNNTATGSIVNGNYSIAGINNSPLLGARVITSLISSGTRNADAVVTQTANKTSVNWGDAIVYTITLTNNGPNNLNNTTTNQMSFSDIFPPQLTAVTWACAATGANTTCPSATGAGSISGHLKVGSGGNLKFTVSANIVAGSGTGSVSNTATATPGVRPDPDTSNNSSTLTLSIGTPRTLTFTKGGSTVSGSVTSAPAGVSCGTACGSASATFVNGTTVVLTATPIQGASFTGWSGACSGTATTCAVAMTANQAVTASFAAAPVVGTATNIYVYSGNNQGARTSAAFGSPLGTLVTDSNGIAVSNVTVTYTAVPVGGASATLSVITKTNAAGISTANATANATAGTYTVTASIALGGGGTASTTFTLINVGNPSAITYVSGGSVTDPNQTPVGTPFGSPLMVLVTDAASHPVPGATVAFSVTPAGGSSATLSSASVVTDSDGHASTTATANNTAGSYTASASTAGVVSTVTFRLTNTASTPANVFVVSGNGQDTPTSTAFDNDLVVGVTDSLGNALPNITVTFTAPASGASLLFSNGTRTITATTDATGSATVLAPTSNATIGAYAVTATVAGVATPATFNMANDGPQVVDVYTGSPQNKTVDAAFSSLVAVVTSSTTGLPISGVVVTFTAPASGATAVLSATTATTDTSGLASIGATAGGVGGSYTVSATTAQSGAPASFLLTNNAGAPTAIAVSAGSGQRTLVNTSFANPLVARVADVHNNPVPNVVVTFAPPGSAPTGAVIGSPATSDAAGLASVSATAGATAGSYNVAASASGAGSVNFSLTNDECNADSDCASDKFCNTSAHACTAKIANGVVVPTIAGHAPALTGVCSVAVGTAVCISGVCDTADNKCGYADGDGTCDGTTAPTVCRSTLCSVSGACKPSGGCLVVGDCGLSNASAACTAGACTIASCNSGFGNCDGNTANGCERVTSNDVGNCGGCGNVCNLANSTETCAGGVCGVGSCDPGYMNCNALAIDGCEVLTSGGDANNCGGCGTICSPAHASGACTTGACGIGSCNAGYSNCNGTAADGCEVLTDGSDVNNCGGCGTVCGPAHASGACTAGACGIGSCNAGYADCDDNPSNGCEMQVGGSDVNNCGGCGTVCSLANASGACAAGTCGVGSCNAGYGNCNGTAGDGCEVLTGGSDVANCGGCGTTCAANEYCSVGACITKKPNSTSCSSPAECSSDICFSDGSCGLPDASACASSAVCRGGACSVSGVCIKTDGCAVDGDCPPTDFCDTAIHECSVKLPNGTPIPTIAGHDPALTGACTLTVGGIVCAAAVCDSADSKCGHANGEGPCASDTATTLCRSGVCGSDGECGYPNGEGSCTDSSAMDICRSGLCHNGVCSPPPECTLDAQCTQQQFCDTAEQHCTAKLPNGTPIPTIASHDPALTGVCTTDVGAAVCEADVCDANDDRCGYRNGDGPCDAPSAATVCRSSACGSDSLCGYPNGEGSCTSVNAGVVCRSGLCSPNTHECVATIGCLADADCLSTQFCDTSVNVCTAKLGNAIHVPTIANHTPDLDGNCTSAVGHAVCSADVCDTVDDACGYLNGDGPCSADDAGAVCRSGVCGGDSLCGYPDFGGDCTSIDAAIRCRGGLCSLTSHVCAPQDGCLIDADCPSDAFCDTALRHCTPKLPNAAPIPTIASHDPALTGACTTSVGSAVCLAAVCDGSDDKCGYPNGRGTCDDAIATTVCRSGVCGGDGACGYPDGEGSCSNLNAGLVCRSGLCSATQVCAPPPECAVDGDCDNTRFCDTATFHCTLKLPNGTPIPSIANHDPALTGDCIQGVGSAVCSAGVCDIGDDQCGYANGDGACDGSNAALVCRSGVCGSDELCGYRDGEGSCTGLNASLVCRSGQCSPTTHACLALTACTVDSECVSTQFCDTSTNACATKLRNGIDIPTIVNHTPGLDGNCTSPVGHAVCSADVCDLADDKCGYRNGDGPCADDDAGAICRSGVCGRDALCGYPNFEGPCTSIDAVTLCRSGMCSAVTHVCVPAGGCSIDADCTSAQFCNTASNLCVSKLPNGTQVPTIADHTPALTGACSTAVATAVCSAGVCSASDDKCGYRNGEGSCTQPSAASVCRSGVCGSDGKCGYPDGEGSCDASNAGTLCRSALCSAVSSVCIAPGGCAQDADCADTQFCDTAASQCTTKLSDGTAIPKLPHHEPALTGTCNAEVGKAVCRAGVCDTTDDKCGLANGDGACTADNAATVCRSNVCGSDGKCGFPDGEGTCTSMNAGSVCRTAVCPDDTGMCGTPATSTGCASDGDCASTQFCDTSTHACTQKLDDGAAIPVIDAHAPVLDGKCSTDVGASVCKAAVCDGSDDACAYANGTGPCDGDDASTVCRSNVCGDDGECGLPDGAGPCTSMNAGTLCRSGICSGTACGPAKGCSASSECDKSQFCDTTAMQCKDKRRGEGQCSSDAQCQSDSCDLASHRCNTCVGTKCGRLKLAGGGFGCSTAQPGTTGGTSNDAFAVFALLLFTLVRRPRRGAPT